MAADHPHRSTWVQTVQSGNSKTSQRCIQGGATDCVEATLKQQPQASPVQHCRTALQDSSPKRLTRVTLPCLYERMQGGAGCHIISSPLYAPRRPSAAASRGAPPGHASAAPPRQCHPTGTAALQHKRHLIKSFMTYVARRVQQPCSGHGTCWWLQTLSVASTVQSCWVTC